jgi:endonuclease YncB( thermonuclease family)
VRVACGVIALCATIAGAHAQDVRAETACRFEGLGSSSVANVLDGRSFVLKDGREVRIAAIEVPPVPAANQSTTAGAAAKAALEALLAGQMVELQDPFQSTDRYERTIAFVQRAGMKESVGHTMLALGLARVAARVGNAACAAELLSRERVARTAKLGLWADPRYEVREAGDGLQLLAALGHFTVVEGRVLSVRESGGTIYLNFGRRWSEALTVTISKRQERIFAAAGIGPRRLENLMVRVRGWIEERNGPRIEASRPEQIEVAGLN